MLDVSLLFCSDRTTARSQWIYRREGCFYRYRKYIVSFV